MRAFIDFIIKYSSRFLFLIYVVLSCMLLFDKNPYQHHIYMTSANAVTGAIYGLAGNVSSYFSLGKVNEDLQKRNAELEGEVLALREHIAQQGEQEYAREVADSLELQYHFIVARVINNSINRPANYITINKGSADGIRPEMGVVNHDGVVGIVNVVGPHYSRVISLLNPNFHLSCKVKGTDAFGSLLWDGESYLEALLEELPRHGEYSPGDTIVTSGYSALFPPGVPVGTIKSMQSTIDNNFISVRVQLSTDFTRLSYVQIINSEIADEIKAVEKDPEESKK